MNIGARVLKTGLAVTVALLICKVLKIEPALFAALTVVVNMQPSVSKSLKNAWEQISIHVIGVILALVLGLLLGNNPLVMGLAVIIMILFCNRIGWSSAIILGIVSAIFVLDTPPERFLQNAGIRSLAVFIGLGVALLTNRIIVPPEYKAKLTVQLELLFNETSLYFLQSIVNFITSSSLTVFEVKKPVELQKRLEEVLILYERAREELTPKDNVLLLERQLEICRGFIERGQNINEMTELRVQRRLSPDAPVTSGKVSPEFQEILDILAKGEANLEVLTKKVGLGFNNAHAAEEIGDNNEYWAPFDLALEHWHRNVSGVFYLRAMMEIAVVATEMRWAGRRLRTLYNLSALIVTY